MTEAEKAIAMWSEWLGLPVEVRGGDYTYTGILVSVFKKRRHDFVRMVVEDDQGRLFIHNPSQVWPIDLGDPM
jgi:hypothetical protein